MDAALRWEWEAIVTSDSALGDGFKLKAQAPNLVLGLRWMRKCRIPRGD